MKYVFLFPFLFSQRYIFMLTLRFRQTNKNRFFPYLCPLIQQAGLSLAAARQKEESPGNTGHRTS